MEFATELPPYAISGCITDRIISGEDAEFEVTVKNSTSDDKDAMILPGLYKREDLRALLQVKFPGCQHRMANVTWNSIFPKTTMLTNMR